MVILSAPGARRISLTVPLACLCPLDVPVRPLNAKEHALRDRITRIEHRRSQRVILRVPLKVSEAPTDLQSKIEETYSLAVNKHGGLIALRAKVSVGQTLTLFNKATRETKECRVVCLGPTQIDKRQVGIEFAEPVTDFWKIAFPAPGSKAVPE
jgi:hypothetical protein